MFPELHPRLDLVRNLVGRTHLGKILLFQIRRHGSNASVRIQPHLCLGDHLLIQIRSNNADLSQGYMPGQSHHQRIGLVACGTGGAPYLQIFSEFTDQFRKNLLVHDLPLFRITVKLGHVDRYIVDKFLKQGLIVFKCLHVFVIALNAMLINQCINPTFHLTLLVGIQINCGQTEYLLFQIFVIKLHGIRRPLLYFTLHLPPQSLRRCPQIPRLRPLPGKNWRRTKP